MLDTTGKLYEHLLRLRLTEVIRNGGELSNQEFGFRRGRSTIGAIQKVVNVYEDINRHCRATPPIIMLATVDVRNTFNSARWVSILETLRSDFRI